ncbi:hypothetical protein ANN_03213 [Periplaneta americana]|uniref:Uncharacterized protein n=1 Tax=Periplaneta americana TaxID=6978 RepID=A0ABQ8U1T2_PERAM|nr:hypothetical protein ANN_03213 [Periplaneta americana]
MAGLCEGGNEHPGSLKANKPVWDELARSVFVYEETDRLTHSAKRKWKLTSAVKHGADPDPIPARREQVAKIVVVITEDVQNVHLLLEYRPHINVSLTCEHDPKLQEYCVCPQNMPQFDSEGIPNQAPETNKPMILNGPTSRNREGSDQVSVEVKQLCHLYLSIDQEIFDPSTGEPYD